MERLKSAIENNKAAMIRIFLKEPRENTLLLTKGQILKIQQGQMQGKDSISIKLSMPQIKANIDSGGFLGEVEEDLLLREGEEEDFDRKLEWRWCSKKFTRKSNLDRHIVRTHDNKSIHYHGLQYIDKKYITKETQCFLHEGGINDGKMFHCFVCNFSICADCMEEDCKYCNRDLCNHKKILIVIN